MGLTEKYNNYLQNKKAKEKSTYTFQKLPSELQPAINPIQVAPTVKEVLHEFISLVPDALWKSFPGNATPQLRLEKEENAIYKSISYSIYRGVPLGWYSQIIGDNDCVKSIHIQYVNSRSIYKNKSIESYCSEREKNRINKKIDEAFRVADLGEQDAYITYKKNYCALLNHYGKDLSQSFIRLTYFIDDVLDEVGYLVIFKDENVYDWTVHVDSVTKKEKYQPSITHLKKSPLATKETAEAFFLEKLKFQPQSESLTDGLCPHW